MKDAAVVGSQSRSEAEKWLDELTKSTSSEDLYMSALYPSPPVVNANYPDVQDYVALGGPLHGRTISGFNRDQSSFEYAIPARFDLTNFEVHELGVRPSTEVCRYFRHVGQYEGRDLYFWVHESIQHGGPESVMQAIVLWIEGRRL